MLQVASESGLPLVLALRAAQHGHELAQRQLLAGGLVQQVGQLVANARQALSDGCDGTDSP